MVIIVIMGAGISAASMADEDAGEKPKLGDIPENCVALIMMSLDPPDVCKCAKLSRTFRTAASADFIWESKLPSNYLYVMDRVFENSTMVVEKLTKRDIYATLCSCNSFDNGTKANSLSLSLSIYIYISDFL